MKQQFSLILQLIRVKQWVKNLFVFIPAFFAGTLQTTFSVSQLTIAFLSFSCASGCVYILNDWIDIEQDQTHPTKKFRPIAAQNISGKQALWIAVVLLVISAVGVFYLNSAPFLYILGTYLIMNIAYSIKLKQLPILDISIIAMGFLLRIFAGSVIAQVHVSHWLTLLTFQLALLLALGKRRGELLLSSSETKTRKSLSGYNLKFIDSALSTISASTIVCYIMYTISTEVMVRVKSEYLYFSTGFVLLGILRYLQQTFVAQQTESPTEFLLKDGFLQLVLILWAAFFAYLLYFQ